ncbi:poly [ADP-ribose] polymerase 2-like isoform X2 [Papaver somniferum]|uniref:poly [ADP-ribose] polymerase 2-like isoform X2 n=1 Tax=Papaver somniferum TaxID=3469 RepID=UPI000E7006F2|nr:poly [ADP-ribose] polymerase 2-like isoform X2 [Papaver somniferum]XP_026388466.1 poly [ADP-ribose] polymerase 2-like isoform X2 [Papaver somniferum]
MNVIRTHLSNYLETSTLLSLMTTVSKKCVAEFIIDTPQKLKSKIKMVEALGEIELATKLLKDEDDTKGDLLNAWYNRLQCELQAIDADSKDYLMIEKYMRNTHLNADSSYSVDIVQFFRVSTKFESEPFRKFSITKNRMLLWYGSRLANWTGILSQGLHIAPPQSPVSGYMFGKGVYFADMFLKSANLCCPSSSSRDGVLLLCEVALDEMAELRGVHNAVQLPEGKQSIKVVGSTAPDPSESEVLDDGVVVPLGKPKNHGDQKVDLLHNEHIVYSVDQIRMRYLIHVEFNYN